MRAIQRTIKFSLLYTAALIMLLHALVPHQHHAGNSLKTTVSSCQHSENTLLGFLGKVFHTDLGDEHLENYKPVKKVDLGFDLTVMAAALTYATIQQNISGQPSFLIPRAILGATQTYAHSLCGRAPPVS